MSEYSQPTQFIDLVSQQKVIKHQLDTAIAKVLDHGQYIMGPEVKEFELKLEEFTGSKFALTCANGTDALTLILMAWGIGPGDAVFVPSFTYVASAEAPCLLGATPFFVDVLEDSFNIDPNSFKQAIIDCHSLGLNPKVVIAVDLFGQPCDFDAISEIAGEEKIKVLIDGAQSFGGSSKGRKVGSMGDATITSFFPAKPLGCYGDGGAIFTNNEEDMQLIDSIRLHGRGEEKYDVVRVGLNSRLDTLQAAILIEKLKIFPAELEARNVLAREYTQQLLNKACALPFLDPDNNSSWAQYTIRSSFRDHFRAELKSKGIPTVIYYPKPLHLQHGYQMYPKVSSGLVNSENLSNNVFSLPMHPYINNVHSHVENIKAIFNAINLID